MLDILGMQQKGIIVSNVRRRYATICILIIFTIYSREEIGIWLSNIYYIYKIQNQASESEYGDPSCTNFPNSDIFFEDTINTSLRDLSIFRISSIEQQGSLVEIHKLTQLTNHM